MMIKYSVAPYNFVSFPEKSGAAYKSMEELPCHNVYSNELLNGVITYEIEAKSPVIVSKGNDKNSNNRNDFCKSGRQAYNTREYNQRLNKDKSSNTQHEQYNKRYRGQLVYV